MVQVRPMGGRSSRGNEAMNAKMALLRSMKNGGRRRMGGTGLVLEPMADYPRVGSGADMTGSRAFMGQYANPDVGGFSVGGYPVGGFPVGGYRKGVKATAEQKARQKATRAQNKALKAQGQAVPRRYKKVTPLQNVKQLKRAIKQILFPSKAIIEKYGEFDWQPEELKELLRAIMVYVPEDDALVIHARRGGAWYDDLWSGIKSVASTAAPFLPLLL
jgi:hypothetical protein